MAVVLVDGNIAKSPHANWATSVSSQKTLMVLTNVLIVVEHFREIRFGLVVLFVQIQILNV